MLFLRKNLAKKAGLKEKHILEDEFERSIRRKYADWNFINKQPPRIKAALKYYIETGDLRLAQKIAKMNIEEFYELVKKAKIPTVIIREN